MPIWVNRRTRRRHVDRRCRALTLSDELRAELRAEEPDGNAIPDRIYELSGNERAEVIEAVEAFTVPVDCAFPARGS
jgi:hypothetical protein